ncbi:acyl-CoA dehydrogenase family protein, partial [Nocardiopsis gilva]
MFIDLTEEQRELRDHLRAYLSAVMTPQERAHPTDPPAYKRVIRRMGRDGMLGWGWPTEYGGRGLGALEQQIFVNEVTRAEVPYPLVTLQTVGPALLHHGTPEQKQRFLPGIL